MERIVKISGVGTFKEITDSTDPDHIQLVPHVVSKPPKRRRGMGAKLVAIGFVLGLLSGIPIAVIVVLT